jgi:hypothetical protein
LYPVNSPTQTPSKSLACVIGPDAGAAFAGAPPLTVIATANAPAPTAANARLPNLLMDTP